MKSFLKWLAIILTVIFILIFGAVITISSLMDTEPIVDDNSYLHISLSGSLAEYEAPDPVEEMLGQTHLNMKKVRDILEKAAVDERINGIVLNLNNFSVGFGKLHELHSYIEKYKESGKKIYAYMEMPGIRDYYTALACDSVFMAPSGTLFLQGFNAEITFYKSFLKMLGVEAEFMQIGKYKNAPDPYIRDKMSPYQKEVLESILNQYFDDLLSTISEKRGIAVDKVKELINREGAFTAKEALKYHFIDNLHFKDEITIMLKKEDKPLPDRIEATDYARIPASSLDIRNKSRIAVINCTGVIASGSDTDDPFYGKTAGSSTLVKNLKKAAKSKSIKAIIFRIDSPGGSALASDLIWKAVKEAAEKKPVIASVVDLGASGGYYITTPVDSFFAASGSLVGSIGIFAGKFNIRGLYDKLNLKSESVRIGDNATLFSIMDPWTKQEKNIIFKIINDFYVDFVQKVADARGKTYEQIDNLGQGHVWTSEQALENGLVDNVGGFYEALKAAKETAGIDAEESVRLSYYPKKKSFFGNVLNKIEMIVSVKINPVESLVKQLEKIQNKPMALMPYKIEW
jgi:protease-4